MNPTIAPLNPAKCYKATPKSSNRSPFFFMGAERTYNPDNYGTMPDGTLKCWPFDYSFLHSPDGRIIGVNDNCGTTYDITEEPMNTTSTVVRSNLRAALDAACSARLFLAAAGHQAGGATYDELNTTIASIRQDLKETK